MSEGKKYTDKQKETEDRQYRRRHEADRNKVIESLEGLRRYIETSGEQRAAEENEQRRFDRRTVWIDKAAVIIATGALGFLVWQDIILRQTMHEAKIAADNQYAAMQNDQRAWVAPQTMTFDSPIVSTQNPAITLHYVNTGHVPALGTVVTTESFFQPVDERGNVTIPPNNLCDNFPPVKGARVLYPQYNAEYALSLAIQPKPENVMSEVLAQKKVLVINGCIAYETLSTPHHSGFCYMLRTVPGRNEWRFGVCPTGYSTN